MTFARRRLCAAIGLILMVHGARAAEPAEESWEPGKTWVFAVGICHWKDSKTWHSFPEKDRLEPALVGAFKTNGVPNEHVTYLQDNAATQQNIRREFVTLLEKTHPGDVLIVYFQGHGSWDRESGKHYLACYDADDKHTWAVDAMFDTIDRHFKGRRALLMADCCGSGGIVKEARTRKGGRIDYAAIASSFRNNPSSGAWTFSACLLKGLRGDPAVDLNSDGVITLGEFARHAELEMAFIEQQRSVAFFGDAFPKGYRFHDTKGKRDPAAGDHVEAKWTDGNWWKAETIEKKDGKVNVRYVDDNTTAWLTPAEVRAWKPPVHFDVNSRVLARPEEQDEKWCPATVTQTFEGLHCVRFENAKHFQDQWVAYDHIKAR